MVAACTHGIHTQDSSRCPSSICHLLSATPAPVHKIRAAAAAAAVKTCTTETRLSSFGTIREVRILNSASAPTQHKNKHSHARKNGETASAVLALTLVALRNLNTKQWSRPNVRSTAAVLAHQDQHQVRARLQYRQASKTFAHRRDMLHRCIHTVVVCTKHDLVLDLTDTFYTTLGRQSQSRRAVAKNASSFVKSAGRAFMRVFTLCLCVRKSLVPLFSSSAFCHGPPASKHLSRCLLPLETASVNLHKHIPWNNLRACRKRSLPVRGAIDC